MNKLAIQFRLLKAVRDKIPVSYRSSYYDDPEKVIRNRVIEKINCCEYGCGKCSLKLNFTEEDINYCLCEVVQIGEEKII